MRLLVDLRSGGALPVTVADKERDCIYRHIAASVLKASDDVGQANFEC